MKYDEKNITMHDAYNEKGDDYYLHVKAREKEIENAAKGSSATLKDKAEAETLKAKAALQDIEDNLYDAAETIGVRADKKMDVLRDAREKADIDT